MQEALAEQIGLAGTNPPPSFLFFVLCGSLALLYIICGQAVQLISLSAVYLHRCLLHYVMPKFIYQN